MEFNFKFEIKQGEEPLLYEQLDGKFSFFVEEPELTEIETRLVRHNIQYVNEGVSSEIGKKAEIKIYSLVSSSSREDITFAIEDCIKLLRPYTEY